jgi:hypothetical protein
LNNAVFSGLDKRQQGKHSSEEEALCALYEGGMTKNGFKHANEKTSKTPQESKQNEHEHNLASVCFTLGV